MNSTRTALSSAVLPLRLTFADGYQLQASASVVGSNDLLTATHVLYQPQHGGWATGLALLGTQQDTDGQVRLNGTATSISGWQVWANPQQVYADTDPTTLTLGESQYDVALIGVDRLLDQSGLTLTGNAAAGQGTGLGYAAGQRLDRIDTGLQHGQDGYSVFGSTDSTLGPGSSGGPLLDGAGQIIGVNSSGTPGQATWWADIGPFLSQLTAQMQANDDLLQATGPFPAGPVQISTGTTLPDLPATGQETVAPQLPNAVLVGGEFRVNSYTSNSQWYPAITALADGGYVVTWTSVGQDGSGAGIYAQRYASNGSAVGGEFRVNSTTVNNQDSPALSALADGGYVVTWASDGQDGSGAGIYAQRYASNGSAVGGEFRVNSTTADSQWHPALSALADGGYVVTWTSVGQDGSGYGIYAQHYASNGSAVGGEFRVNSTTANNQDSPALTALADGGYVVTWTSFDQNGSGYGIYAQRYASNGSAVGREFRVNSTTANDQYGSAISALADGGYVVAWQSDGQDGSGWGIYAQRYASNGSAVGGEFRVNSSTVSHQWHPAVSALADGGYVVTWIADGLDGSWDVNAQRYASNGSAVGGEFRVNSTTAGNQAMPALSALADGGYVVTWADNGLWNSTTNSYDPGQDGSGDGIYAQRYAAQAEAPSSLSISAVSPSVSEGSGGGTTPASFTVSRDNGNGSASVNWAFQPGTATADDLSGATSGTVSFAAGETSKTITLNINADTSVEQDETFSVVLSAPVNATLGTSSATQTLRNDDELGTLSISTASSTVTEGSGGSTPVSFTVSRDNGNGSASVNWAVQHATTDAADFNGATSGTVYFNPGETSKTITLNLNADTSVEQNEAFSVVLSNPVNARLGTSSATQTIRDDDHNPGDTTLALHTQTTSLNEGSGGGSTLMNFEIARTGLTSGASSVDWAIQPGSADASDFSGITSGSVSFAPGETSKSLQIAINRDNVYEPDETFSIALKNPVGAVIGTASISETIQNDDAKTQADGVLYRFAKLNGNYFYTANPEEIQYIQDNYIYNKDKPNLSMRFEGYAFNCLKGGGQAVYRYALLDNGGGYFYTADAGERQYAAQHPEAFLAEGVDGSGVQQPAFYAALNNDQSATAVYRLKNGNGGYLFTASEAEKNAAIGQYGYTYEQIAFKVPTAGTPSGFALAAGQDSQFAAEGSGTGGSLKYTVLRIGDASGSASVQWSVKGTGANPTEADDFVGATSGTLSFGANETAKTLTLQFNGDSAYGTDETFSVILSNPQGEPVLVGSMAGRIVNDDSLAPKGGATESAYEGPLLHAAQLHPELPLVGGALAEAGWW